MLCEETYLYISVQTSVCKGTYLIKCHFVLSVECSPVSHPVVWKVFVRNTEQLELNCLGLCIYSWERQRLYHRKSLNLVWHLPVLTLLILVLTPGSSVRFLWPDETELCYFSSLFIFLHRSSRLPLVGGIRYDVSHDTVSHLVFGHFTLAEPETFFSLYGRRLLQPQAPVLAGQSAPASGPLSLGALCCRAASSCTSAFRGKFRSRTLFS